MVGPPLPSRSPPREFPSLSAPFSFFFSIFRNAFFSVKSTMVELGETQEDEVIFNRDPITTKTNTSTFDDEKSQPPLAGIDTIGRHRR